MFHQLSIFVFSVLISIALTIYTNPKLLLKAEWSISANTYLLNPKTADLIGHHEYLDMKGNKLGEQNIIFDYFGNFINKFKLESFRLISNNNDLVACMHGPLGNATVNVDYVTDELIKSKYFELNIKLSSSNKKDLENCIRKINDFYLFLSKEIFNSENFPYNDALNNYNRKLNNLNNTEKSVILNLSKIFSVGISNENLDVLLKLLREINTIQDNKEKLEKQISFLLFSKNYIDKINFVSREPKYSTSLDTNKIGRFLSIFFIAFFFINIIKFLYNFKFKNLIQKHSKFFK